MWELRLRWKQLWMLLCVSSLADVVWEMSEVADYSSSAIAGSKSASSEVNFVKKKHFPGAKPCWRCTGRHDPSQCRYKNETCFFYSGRSHVKAKVRMKPTARSKLCKAASVHYAVCDELAKELDRLVWDGVLENIDFAEWASRIVAVRKQDRGLRVCADFKTTVNPQLEVNQYPLSTPGDFFFQNLLAVWCSLC